MVFARMMHIGKSAFALKSHLVLLTGDTAGISKVFHLSAHVAKYSCRACKHEGTAYTLRYKLKDGGDGTRTQYYYPLLPPTRYTSPNLDSWKRIIEKLPRRNEAEYLADGRASVQNSDNATKSGVMGISPFAHIPTMSFSDSIPFNVMHLVFLGFVRDFV